MGYKIQSVAPAQERLKRLKQPVQNKRDGCEGETFQSLLSGLMKAETDKDRGGK